MAAATVYTGEQAILLCGVGTSPEIRDLSEVTCELGQYVYEVRGMRPPADSIIFLDNPGLWRLYAKFFLSVETSSAPRFYLRLHDVTNQILGFTAETVYPANKPSGSFTQVNLDTYFYFTPTTTPVQSAQISLYIGVTGSNAASYQVLHGCNLDGQLIPSRVCLESILVV